jgi:peptide/nickel transport system permease protein
MKRYIVIRSLHMLLTMLVVTVVVFIILRLSGDPAELLLGMGAGKEQYEALRTEMGFDKPIPIQYLIYLKGIFQGDFGESYRFNRPALEVVLERYPATIKLAGIAMAISLLIALPVGIYAAVKRGTVWDSIARGLAILGQSLPNFWLGIVLILIFSVWLGWLPTAGLEGLASYFMPALAIGYFITAGIMRLTRSSMLEVLRSDYIRLARAKGVSSTIVIWKHALKNAAVPVLTFAILLFAQILNGSIIIETVFAWPGIGKLVVDSVFQRDFPIIQTVVIFYSLMYILGNFVADILYAYFNPKVRY